MTRPHLLQHDRSAPRGGACAGAAWIDSGIAPGLVVVDSNRPCPVAGLVAGYARGLRKQFDAAH